MIHVSSRNSQRRRRTTTYLVELNALYDIDNMIMQGVN